MKFFKKKKDDELPIDAIIPGGPWDTRNRPPKPTYDLDHSEEEPIEAYKMSPQEQRKNYEIPPPVYPSNQTVPPFPENPVVVRQYTPKPLYEKKSVIIFVVENSLNINTYKNEVVRLINKIVADNSSQFFMLLRIGNKASYSALLDAKQFKAENWINRSVDFNNTLPTTIDLADALMHIQRFVKDNMSSLKIITIDGLKYHFIDARIIFIGTGKTDTSIQTARQTLKSLCTAKEIKTIKYFCLKDEDAINAAIVGFPVIGHIEANFYK